MKGIKFDDVHSFTDLNLVLTEVNIPPATVKTNFVDIPGGDGSVDLTEAHGEVKYNDRECTFTFTVFPYEDFEVKKKQVSNLLNGKRCKITVDKDPDYYWLGRCSVNEYASNKNLHKIVVGARVAPYKLKQSVTTVVWDGAAEYTWDGDTTGVTTVKGMDAIFWHISSDVPPLESFEWGGRLTWIAKQTGKVTTNELVYPTVHEDGYTFFPTIMAGVAVATKDNAKIFDVVLPKKGIYFAGITTSHYTTSLVFDYPSVNLTNGKKKVVPTITCQADDTVVFFNGNYFDFNAGTHKNLGITLTEGVNVAMVDSTGSVTFTYQEGDL